ncbi:MAG: UDP-2,3-diacylglucosamine diphosphatase LpxI [Planctomycetota bacterium]
MTAAPHRPPDRRTDPVGLIAGWGRFPVQVAETLLRQGRPVQCVAIVGHADKTLNTLCDHVLWSGVGRMSGHMRFFRRHAVREVTMAGKLFKSDLLYQRSVLLQHRPDWKCLRTFAPLLWGRSRDTRDDSLLMAVTKTYQRSGMDVIAATDLAPELLIPAGPLWGRPADAKTMHDITAGWRVAKQMGGMDIGQSITIKDGTVIAVEAIEGTDACIERTGQLCRKGGWVLVKVSKPNQDMRFDVPTIGPNTVQNVAKAGGRAIAIEAGKTIVVDREATIAAAKQAKIGLIAYDQRDLLAQSAA